MNPPRSPDRRADGAEQVLVRLADELADEGSVISPHVRRPTEPPALGLLVAAGPRAAPAPLSYASVVECVREGYLLHYGAPRILAGSESNLDLLAGDYLYARGLERLAALGDLEAITELGDLISLVAQAHAGEGGAGEAAKVAWLAATTAIAAGGDPAHSGAKERLRSTGDALPLWRAAQARAADAGLASALTRAAETVGFAPPDRG